MYCMQFIFNGLEDYQFYPDVCLPIGVWKYVYNQYGSYNIDHCTNELHNQ